MVEIDVENFKPWLLSQFWQSYIMYVNVSFQMK